MDRRRAAILVPRRLGEPEREASWAFVRARLVEGGWYVHEGWHEAHEGPFNRSQAVNRAAAAADAARAEPWAVAVILDADTFVPDGQIAAAVELAAETGVLSFGFDRYVALDEPGSAKVLAGYVGDWERFVAYSYLLTASSCVVVRRDLWNELGGMDERFVGWGWEDAAFSFAAQTLGGGMHRVPGTAWHLWHPQGPDVGNDQSPIWRANKRRAQRYERAHGDVDAMREALRR